MPTGMLGFAGRMAKLDTASRWVLLLAVAASSACRASGTTPFQRPTDDPDAGPTIIVDAGGVTPPDAPVAAPHALLAIEPPHGPFSGGTAASLRGNGFNSAVRVWFGENEVPSDDVIAVSPQRIQVTVPPGVAGTVDIAAQNGEDASTRVTFKQGYTYDSFYAAPSSGPTSGGTLVTLHGEGTLWDSETEVSVDREPCEIVEVKSEQELVCRTPPGTAGSRPVRVTTSDGVVVDVLDAFTYGNTDNGFRGGLSGQPLDGELRVLAFDSITGRALPGATVIVGTEAPLVEKTDRQGIAVVRGELGARQTVTLALHCFQPVTFVDVPVDTLTVYLDPVLASVCFDPEGEIPSGGGTFGQGGGVSGELVWPQLQEFRKEGWTNVPQPKSEDEHLVAYVFPLASQATDRFSLPSAAGAITPAAEGDFGFRFNLSVRPGNYTLYALSGLENRARSPYVFTPYSMGLIRGVSIPAGTTAQNIFIRLDVPLDQALDLEVTGPKPTRRGPDRLAVNVAIRVGTEGYVLLPGAEAQTLLGKRTQMSLVGLPPLIRSLSGTSYVAAARAVTGSSGATPRSVLGLIGATTTANPLAIGPFIEVPVLTAPETNAAWNGRDLLWTSAPGGLAPDLVVVDILTNGDLYNWRIVAPGSRKSFALPDLSSIHESLAWPRGAQTFTVALAQLDNFDYGSLRYRDLTERGWLAHATDSFFATF